MFHWRQRVHNTLVRMGEIDPEHDTPAQLRVAALAKANEALQGITALDAYALARQLRAAEAAYKTRTTPTLRGADPPMALLNTFSIAFITLCAAWNLDAEILLEEAVQTFEARKKPAPEPTIAAPTAAEIMSPRQQDATEKTPKASRQFTL